MAGRNRIAEPLHDFTVSGSMPGDLVSPNFALCELTRSDIAARRGLDNRIKDDAILRAAIHTARTVLQPVRDAHGRFTPNSVYRSQHLERVLKRKPPGWTSASQHTKGEACDIEIPGMPTLELARWCVEHLDFDQVICECYDPRQGPNSGWVHVSTSPPGAGTNRHAVLSYIRATGGRWVYVDGLKASA